MKIRLIRRRLLTIGATACVFGISLQPVDAGPSVVVQVDATDDSGSQLKYRWRSTDGVITDPSSRQTEWVLPDGPGLHIAYVLVSNGKGGYTEAHITVNTDPNPVTPRPTRDLLPPLASASQAVPFRAWVGGGISSYTIGGVNKNFKVALPDIGLVPVFTNQDIFGTTSLAGDFVFQQFIPPVSFAVPVPFTPVVLPNIGCNLVGFPPISPDSLVIPCLGTAPDHVVDVEANQTNRIDLITTTEPILRWVTGTVLLRDGSPCGTENEFFINNNDITRGTATIELMQAHSFNARANSWGQFSVPQRDATAGTVVVKCENAPEIQIPIPPIMANDPPNYDVGFKVVDAARPTVRSMSVTRFQEGQPVLDAAAKQGLPSDVVPPRPAKFLAMKGLDTRLSGCRYYQAIGAVGGCDVNGELVDPISFEDWKRTVQIDQYAPSGRSQYRALFVNRADLNLTRDHHSVSYARARSGVCAFAFCPTAGYVCNYPGPTTDITDPMHQNDVNRKIADAAAGRKLVACVAMDYSISPGVNNNQPFTRFLIFGPSGELLPSVNLDGLGEKFPPGTCVVCHGGNRYAGEFPTETGSADLKVHFLPFDVGNMEFYEGDPAAEPMIDLHLQGGGMQGTTKEHQQEAIYQLNQNVLDTLTQSDLDIEVNDAEIKLIMGWYPAGPPGHTQVETFAPPTVDQDFYNRVIARYCRGCHIAQRDQTSIADLNFFSTMANRDLIDKPGAANRRNPPPTGPGGGMTQWLNELVCGQTDDLVRAFAMPNSKVTFDLLWKDKPAVEALRNRTQKLDCGQNPRVPGVN